MSSLETSGPDIPGIQCWIPDGCCGPGPCDISEEDFICQTRTLLPEGDLFNNTKPAILPPSENRGAATVGCARVGCEQLIMGSCCPPRAIPCDDHPFAPQLAVVDSFAAVLYTAIQALCQLLCELDPCCATVTLKCWAARLGIGYPDQCTDEYWSDAVLKFLVCLFMQLRFHVVNLEFLENLAARFGSSIKLRWAGDFSECHPTGWWTMARSPVDCPREACPPEDCLDCTQELIPFTPTCMTPLPSINIIICPSDIRIPGNCNLPKQMTDVVLPHDPELYKAFQWLLPQLLPSTALYCVYECDPPNCIQ